MINSAIIVSSVAIEQQVSVDIAVIAQLYTGVYTGVYILLPFTHMPQKPAVNEISSPPHYLH
jgi:hypothetical protein